MNESKTMGGDERRLPVSRMEEWPDVSSLGLDPGIEEAVAILRGGGIETYESCEGTDGHAYLEPTVAFFGDDTEGMRAWAWAVQHGLPVRQVRRVWHNERGTLVGPHWHITFKQPAERS